MKNDIKNAFLSELRKKYRADMLPVWLHWQFERQESVPHLLDALLPAGAELTLEDCHLLLRHCQPYRHHSRLLRDVWQWILDRSTTGPLSGVPAFRHGLYLCIVDWVAGETAHEVIWLLSRQLPPPELSPAEKTAAGHVWREKLERAGELYLYDTQIFMYHQLYLLTDDPEEKFSMVQGGVRSWQFAVNSPWPSWMADHCRQYPADAARLRQDSLNHILAAPSSRQHEQFMTGWHGIILVGADGFESELVNTIRASNYQHGKLQPAVEWELLSNWHPADPALRAKLLDWWYGLEVSHDHPALTARQRAVFALEEDESRLVAFIEEETAKGFALSIPDGWCPGDPELQSCLVEIVSRILVNSRPPAPLWKLLFRLPVSGDHLMDLIKRTVCEFYEVDVPLNDTLACLQEALQSPGLPPGTSIADIQIVAQMVAGEVEHLPPMIPPGQRAESLSHVALELFREYVRHAADTPEGVDMDWLGRNLGYLCHPCSSLMFPYVADHVVRIWANTPPAGAVTVMSGIWTLGADTLETSLASLPDSLPDVPAVSLSLMALTYLSHPARLHSPANSVGRTDRIFGRDIYVPPATHSRSLLEKLSALAIWQSEEFADRFVFLMATRVGHYLACHQDTSGASDWWTALSQPSADIILASHLNRTFSSLNLSHVVRHEFLMNYLSRALEANPPGDATGLWRVLRGMMHRFPDHPTVRQPIWPDIFAVAKELWEQQWEPQSRPETKKVQGIYSIEKPDGNLNKPAALCHDLQFLPSGHLPSRLPSRQEPATPVSPTVPPAVIHPMSRTE